ncbi:MAG: hypothetical protein JXQ69_00205 [Paludibacteraceae bacterium]|nr:hypothetical protein [Paludibacteraceae bacterium]MBN2786717.1 hypothetical protein [Paludibacteraceae bacterium]
MRLLFSICFFVIASFFCMAQMGDCYKPVKLAHKRIKGNNFHYKSDKNRSLGYISVNTYYIHDFEFLFNYAYDIKLYKSLYLESSIGLNDYSILDVDNPSLESNQSLTSNILGISAGLSPKWYFTQHIREGSGKTIKGNAGEFIGIKSSFVYSPRFEISKSIYYFGPTIGIRRTFFSHLITEVSFSALYTNRKIIDSNYSGLYTATLHPEVTIRIGYLF